MRRSPLISLALVLIGSAAVADTKSSRDAKDPKPRTVDPNPDKLETVVLRDRLGGTYVVVGTNGGQQGQQGVWFGNGKTLYQQTKPLVSRDGPAWQFSVWTPRLGQFRKGLVERKKDGSYFKACAGIDDGVLVEVLGDKREEVLTKYSFLEPLTLRRAHALGRNDDGLYYYVDTIKNKVAHRLFIGKKGAMKQVPLTDVTTDPAGELYITRVGTLKVDIKHVEIGNSLTKQQFSLTWIKGERRTPLTFLDLEYGPDIEPMIYRDLGVYGELGTICDNT